MEKRIYEKFKEMVANMDYEDFDGGHAVVMSDEHGYLAFVEDILEIDGRQFITFEIIEKE